MRATCWIITIGIIGLLMTNVRPAIAQSPNIVVQVTPNTVKLSPNEETTVLVSLAPLTAPLYETRLTFIGDPVVQLTPSTPIPETLNQHIGYAWQIRVKSTSAFTEPRTITVRLDYQSESGGGTRVPGIALATLNVQPRTLETVDKVAQLRLETAFDVVQENRPGIAYLILTNISDVPLTVKQITIEHSQSVTVQGAPTFGIGSVIPSQASVTIPYTITAQSRVQPGKSNVLFRIELEWARANHISSGTLYATSKFDVAVFGESALTTVFGVPSFLVLPGLLIVVAIRWIRGMVKKPLALDHKSPEFWILAILFSLGAAYLYPLAANQIGLSLNYLSSYGLGDVLIIWSVSLVVGLLLGAMWHLIEWGIGWIYRWLFLPKPNDTPRDVLRKLGRRRVGLVLPYALVRVGTQRQRGVILAQDRLTKAYWIAPLVRYTWQTPPEERLLNEFDRELERAQNAAKMLQLIERAGKHLEIRWDQGGALQAPLEAPEADVVLGEGFTVRLLAESKKGSHHALPQKDDSVP